MCLTLTMISSSCVLTQPDPSHSGPRSYSRSSWLRFSGSIRDLPVGHSGLVQRHEVDLTRRTTFGTAEEHLVVAFAQELEALCLLVHEYPVQVAGLDRTDLDCLVAPAHDLAGADVRDGRRHFAPLQHDVLGDAAHRVDVDALVVVAQQQLHAVRVRQRHDAVRRDWTLSMLRKVDVVDGGRVEVDRVEALRRAVDHLQSGLLLHGQVDQQRAVHQLAETLKCHKLVVRFGCPRVDLDRVLERNHQKLDPLVLDDLEVDRTLQITHVDPPVAALHLLISHSVGSQDLGLEPGQVVHADAVLLAGNGDQDVLALEHLHLLEPPA